jgi:hypothetical protein
MDNLESLLERVNDIYQKCEKEAIRTGEKFNIFKKIGLLEEDHSKIITELLNPASHGMGNEFIKLFLEEIKRNNDVKFNECNIQDFIKNVRVETEITTKGIEINETEKLNGRVDILVTGNNEEKIVIENKTDTVDGKNQLEKYRHAYPKAWLVYLTKNGIEPSNYKKDDDRLILMSYNHIIDWLEQCKGKSEKFLYLQETIAQYIYLLKSITGQSWRENMSDKIIKALTQSSAYVKSAFEIAEAVKKIDLKIVDQFVHAMEKFVHKEYKLILKPSPTDCHAKNWHIALWHKDWEKECVRIRFQFDGNLDSLDHRIYILLPSLYSLAYTATYRYVFRLLCFSDFQLPRVFL